MSARITQTVEFDDGSTSTVSWSVDVDGPIPAPPMDEPEPSPEPEPTPEPEPEPTPEPEPENYPSLREMYGIERVEYVDDIKIDPGLEQCHTKQAFRQSFRVPETKAGGLPYPEFGIMATVESRVDPDDPGFMFPHHEREYRGKYHGLVAFHEDRNLESWRLYAWGRDPTNPGTLFVSSVRTHAISTDQNDIGGKIPYDGPFCTLPGTPHAGRGM